MIACAIVGLLLNVLGTMLAGSALYSDWKAHGREPLVPWVARLWSSVRSRLPWRRSVGRVHGVGAVVLAQVSVEGRGYVMISADAPVDRQITYLREQVVELHGLIGEQRAETAAKISEVREEVSVARQVASDATAQVEEMARTIAVGTARRQILGLVLIGLGSMVAVLPALFGWT